MRYLISILVDDATASPSDESKVTEFGRLLAEVGEVISLGMSDAAKCKVSTREVRFKSPHVCEVSYTCHR